MTQYIIYCRKSSESEERQVLSIESQIEEVKQLAERLQIQVSETLTESRSAKYPGRPVFGQLMKKVYRGEVKGIISWKLDRLARNPIDGAALVWALDRGKIEEIITPYNHLHNNSNDKFLIQLEFGMAKKYVDDLSDNVKRGNRAKLERGWLPGLPPLGYLNEPKERTIVADPDRFNLVRKMWELLLQGTSPPKIHRTANEEWGLRTRILNRRGGKPLSLSTIYKIFTNPFYYSIIERKEGVSQGKHVPMITEEEYWRAQEILGRKGRPRPKIHQWAFTAIIRCGECGCSITAEEKTNRYRSHYVYYHCTKKKQNIKCTQKTIRLEELERQIVECLERIYVPHNLLNLALSYLNEEEKDERQNEADHKSSLQKTYDGCQRKLETLNQMRLRDLIDDEEYLQEKRRLLDEKIRLEKGLKDFQKSTGTSRRLTAEAFVFAHEAVKRFKEAALEDKRAIMQGIGSNFILKDKKLFIELQKPFLMIQDTLERAKGENAALEPLNNSISTKKLVSHCANVPLWCTLVHDVRTFFEKTIRENSLQDAHHGFSIAHPDS